MSTAQHQPEAEEAEEVTYPPVKPKFPPGTSIASLR